MDYGTEKLNAEKVKNLYNRKSSIDDKILYRIDLIKNDNKYFWTQTILVLVFNIFFFFFISPTNTTEFYNIPVLGWFCKNVFDSYLGFFIYITVILVIQILNYELFTIPNLEGTPKEEIGKKYFRKKGLV